MVGDNSLFRVTIIWLYYIVTYKRELLILVIVCIKHELLIYSNQGMTISYTMVVDSCPGESETDLIFKKKKYKWTKSQPQKEGKIIAVH